MKILLAGALIWAGLPLAASQTPVSNASVNVNSRYPVESVEITGEGEFSLSKRLHDDMQGLVGQLLDPAILEEIASRIRVELHAKAVSHRIARGEQPEHVKVVFEIVRRRLDLDVALGRFLYHSKQGWTGEVTASVLYAANTFAFGILSDNDQRPERNAGVFTRYEHRRLGSDRVRLRLQFESYHQQWNRATLLDLNEHPEVPGIYRTRHNFEPTVSVTLARPLTWTVGLSFQRVAMQFPAARTETSHAVINTLRYHRLWEGADATKHILDAGYNLRAATKVLGTDFAYTRHAWNAGYEFAHGRQSAALTFRAGLIAGRAPLFERFVLGNSHTLRGWNRFDVAPLGGNRFAHQSVDYRYRKVMLFYDTGAVWSRSQEATVRHGAGAGFRLDSVIEGLTIAVAFPLKEGRAEPIFMAGMNF